MLDFLFMTIFIFRYHGNLNKSATVISHVLENKEDKPIVLNSKQIMILFWVRLTTQNQRL